MSPFQNRVEIEHSEQKLSIGGRLVQQNQQPIRYSDILRFQTDPLSQLYKQPSSQVYRGREIQEEQTTTQDGKVLLIITETMEKEKKNKRIKLNIKTRYSCLK